MDDLILYFKNLPWKDWATTIITGGLALAGIIYAQRGKRRIARDTQEASDSAERDRVTRQINTAQGVDLTQRFKALMDGYEGRIKDVTTELAQTRLDLADARADIERVRFMLTSHQDRCRACPYYAGLEPVNAG